MNEIRLYKYSYNSKKASSSKIDILPVSKTSTSMLTEFDKERRGFTAVDPQVIEFRFSKPIPVKSIHPE